MVRHDLSESSAGMIRRYPTLDAALRDVESGTLEGVAAVIVNQSWWRELPVGVQTEYRRRSARLGVELRSDSELSRHFVELVGSEGERPLDTEQRL